MQLYTTTILAATGAVFAAAVQGRIIPRGVSGINCEGSGACGMFVQTNGDGFSDNIINYIANDINQIDDNRHYNNGDHIACLPGMYTLNDGIEIHGGVCAFLQSTTGGVNGDTLKTLISDLRAHGCKVCGSVPTGFPQDNRVKDGMLTVNFVNNIGGCNGVC